ncbi:MAG: hypothetical protein ABJF04_06670 [Reichenbachiella sp.]|uniref:hypothetical protein n=2 Tax=Reichenbachiella sp. TaxID=2184521 RepID=UPI003264B13C
MLTKTNIILCLMPVITFSGCITSENYFKTEIVAKSDVTCKSRAEKMYLFFEGEKAEFNYEVIGLVKVTGRKNSNGDEVLDHLKYEAWTNCANAIINITSETVTKPYINTELTLTDSYSVSAFSGLAILVSEDAIFRQEYQNKAVEIDFIQQVESQLKSDKSKHQTGESVGILLLIGAIVLLAITI